MIFTEKFNTIEMFIDFINSNFKYFNTNAIDIIAEKFNYFKSYDIGDTKNKQLSFIKNNIFKLSGRIITEEFWRTRLWENPKQELSNYQSIIGKIAVSSGSLKGRFSKEWFIKKYGDCLWEIKYNDHKKMRSDKNKKKYQIEKHGTEKYNNFLNKTKISLENFIKRHGKEEGTKKWEDFKNKSRSTLENFIKRHGKEEGTKKWNSYVEKCRYSSSIQYYIDIYGEREGINLYNDFLDKSLHIRPGIYSKKSEVLFNDIISKTNINALYGKNEVTLRLGRKRYRPDFIYNKKIIEFFGDYWHLNPMKYNPFDEVKFPHHIIKTPIETWNDDQNRINDFTHHGYEVLIIWESEYMKNYNDVINKCISFINK